ncbi:hypothetical protein D9758_018346 [Tetrapyrgos nigripes]|uniref:Protein kinase domain-containing protein n=1 Tax=Tetrapyrgos nigripes TaxID=182062 RepID=A0A8H5FB26_9AGAR|nr:hypothetical protein D9758_018346 [Tetrapyrgos nigripes]
MSHSRTTRNNPNLTAALNILFLNHANPKHQVRLIMDLPRDLLETVWRVEHLFPYIESLTKNKFRFSVDPATLEFFKPTPSLGIDDSKEWAKGRLNQDPRSVAVELSTAQFLSKALELDVVGNQFVDLVVVGEALQGEPEERDTVGELPVTFGPYKRYNDLSKNIKKLTPSSAAKSRERESYQKSPSTAVHDGTFAIDRAGTIALETIAQPIEIFYPPFRRISEALENPNFQPDLALLDAISAIVSKAGIIATENEYAETLRMPLSKVLEDYFERAYTTGGHSADGLIGFKMVTAMITALVPLLIMELKRAFGEGGCDPIAQAEYSFLQRWNEPELKPLREKCPCPTLILAGGGPNFALLGAVWADRFIVQRISDIVFLAQASTTVDDLIHKAARFFSAVKLGINDLRQYYVGVGSSRVQPLQPNVPHPRFFPFPTQFRCRKTQETISFCYLRAMDDDDSRNLAYLAETKNLPCKLLIKFSDRYGYEAHQLIADKQRAPDLFYCGLLDGKSDVLCFENAKGRFREGAGGLYVGPMRMIVMEYLEGKNALQTPREEWPRAAHSDIKAAINQLHEAGFVFGDLRLPNVIFVGDGTKLIDFDWSGKEGDVCYPHGLSENAGWVEGVKSFRKIEKEHDLEMLEKHFPAP